MKTVIPFGLHLGAMLAYIYVLTGIYRHPLDIGACYLLGLILTWNRGSPKWNYFDSAIDAVRRQPLPSSRSNP